MGYYGRLPDGTSLEAELWGILRCLKVIAGQELRNVNVESDLEVAVKLIKDGPPQNFPHGAAVDECRELLSKCGSNMRHTPGERNKGNGQAG